MHLEAAGLMAKVRWGPDPLRPIWARSPEYPPNHNQRRQVPDCSEALWQMWALHEEEGDQSLLGGKLATCINQEGGWSQGLSWDRGGTLPWALPPPHRAPREDLAVWDTLHPHTGKPCVHRGMPLQMSWLRRGVQRTGARLLQCNVDGGSELTGTQPVFLEIPLGPSQVCFYPSFSWWRMFAGVLSPAGPETVQFWVPASHGNMDDGYKMRS